jgi:hypothetical protein
MNTDEQNPATSSDPRDPHLDAVYRDAPRDEPPSETDASILAAAHRAVDARPMRHPLQPVWLERYSVPLSLAATIVMGASVTLMLQEHERSPREETPAMPRATPQEEPNAARAPESKKEVERLESRRISPSPPAAPAPPLPSAREPLDAAPKNIAPSGAASAPPAAPSLPPPTPAARDEIKPAPQPALLPRERSSAERADRMTREISPPGEDAWTAVAEMRLSQIRGLRAAGRESEAAERLKEFVKSFPDYPLPPDLR